MQRVLILVVALVSACTVSDEVGSADPATTMAVSTTDTTVAPTTTTTEVEAAVTSARPDGLDVQWADELPDVPEELDAGEGSDAMVLAYEGVVLVVGRAGGWLTTTENELPGWPNPCYRDRVAGSTLDVSFVANLEGTVVATAPVNKFLRDNPPAICHRFLVAGNEAEGFEILDARDIVTYAVPPSPPAMHPALSPDGAWLTGVRDVEGSSTFWVSRPNDPNTTVVEVGLPDSWLPLQVGFPAASMARVTWRSLDGGQHGFITIDLGSQTVDTTHVSSSLLGIGTERLVPGLAPNGDGLAFLDATDGEVVFEHPATATRPPVVLGDTILFGDDQDWWHVDHNNGVTPLGLDLAIYDSVEFTGELALFSNFNGTIGVTELVLFSPESGVHYATDVVAETETFVDVWMVSDNRGAFATTQNGITSFVAISHEGFEVIHEGESIRAPVISRDGSSVAFFSGPRNEELRDLNVLDLDTGEVRRVARVPNMGIMGWIPRDAGSTEPSS